MAYRDEVIADSPVAYWRLGEAVGAATMADETANALNGTYDATNPPTLGTPGLITGGTTCGLFNGTNQKSAVGDNNLLDLTSNFTLEAWVTATSVSAGEHRWLGKGTVGLEGYSVGRQAANPTFFNMGVEAFVFSTVTLTAGVTYHMVFHFDSTFDVRLFLNGADKGQVLGTNAIAANTASLFVGVSTSDVGGEFWDGKIDEVAIYTGLLSSARVQSHFSAGRDTPSRVPTRLPFIS